MKDIELMVPILRRRTNQFFNLSNLDTKRLTREPLFKFPETISFANQFSFQTTDLELGTSKLFDQRPKILEISFEEFEEFASLGFRPDPLPPYKEGFPPPTSIDEKPEIFPDNYREIAEKHFAKIEKELDRVSERNLTLIFIQLLATYLPMHSSFRKAIPEMLKDIKVDDFKSLLKWMRLYRLQRLLSGKLSPEIENQTKAHLIKFSSRTLDQSSPR